MREQNVLTWNGMESKENSFTTIYTFANCFYYVKIHAIIPTSFAFIIREFDCQCIRICSIRKFRTNISIVTVWLIVSLKWNYVKRHKNVWIECVSFVFSKVNGEKLLHPQWPDTLQRMRWNEFTIQIEFNVLFIELHWINDQVNFQLGIVLRKKGRANILWTIYSPNFQANVCFISFKLNVIQTVDIQYISQ